MSNIGTPVLRRQINYIKHIFQTSARRHLLLTGRKDCGKTTRIDALAGDAVPGVRSFLMRDENRAPFQVLLSDRQGNRSCVIGRRERDTMRPVTRALDETGTGLLRQALAASGEWVCVDEIGYLEETSPAYQRALWELFEEKRVLAALRKADNPLICRLRERTDCLVLDLDDMEGWS